MMHSGALFRVLTLAAGVMMLDRLTKAAADAWLVAGRSVPVVPHVFHLTLVHNSGAAFGLLQDRRLFFIGVSVTAIAAIIVYLARHRTVAPVTGVALACILGGAAGNLADRLVFGYVVDFIDLRVWPVFNVADSAITIGAGLLILTLFADKRHAVRPAP